MGILENLAYGKAKRAALSALVASCAQPDSTVPDAMVFSKNQELFIICISLDDRHSQVAWEWLAIKEANFNMVGLGVMAMIEALLVTQKGKG